jgi:hypothetical protein
MIHVALKYNCWLIIAYCIGVYEEGTLLGEWKRSIGWTIPFGVGTDLKRYKCQSLYSTPAIRKEQMKRTWFTIISISNGYIIHSVSIEWRVYILLSLIVSVPTFFTIISCQETF